jgi:hypothetical protein
VVLPNRPAPADLLRAKDSRCGIAPKFCQCEDWSFETFVGKPSDIDPAGGLLNFAPDIVTFPTRLMSERIFNCDGTVVFGVAAFRHSR